MRVPWALAMTWALACAPAGKGIPSVVPRQVLSSTGSLSAELSAAGRLTATVQFKGAPVDLAIVWYQPDDTASHAQVLRRGLTTGEGLSVQLEAPQGALQVIDAACGEFRSARGALVVFRDRNGNHELDLVTDVACADEVLGGDDFRLALAGQGTARVSPLISMTSVCGAVTFSRSPKLTPLFDHPLLALAVCSDPGRYLDIASCGLRKLSVTPQFFRDGDRCGWGGGPQGALHFTDGAPGATAQSCEGRHEIRVELEDLAWVADVVWPPALEFTGQPGSVPRAGGEVALAWTAVEPSPGYWLTYPLGHGVSTIRVATPGATVLLDAQPLADVLELRLSVSYAETPEAFPGATFARTLVPVAN